MGGLLAAFGSGLFGRVGVEFGIADVFERREVAVEPKLPLPGAAVVVLRLDDLDHDAGLIHRLLLLVHVLSRGMNQNDAARGLLDFARVADVV